LDCLQSSNENSEEINFNCALPNFEKSTERYLITANGYGSNLEVEEIGNTGIYGKNE